MGTRVTARLRKAMKTRRGGLEVTRDQVLEVEEAVYCVLTQ